jgi:hypothetical protein
MAHRKGSSRVTESAQARLDALKSVDPALDPSTCSGQAWAMA